MLLLADGLTLEQEPKACCRNTCIVFKCLANSKLQIKLMCACAGSQASEEEARPRGAPDTNPPSTSGRPSDPIPPHHSPNHKHEEDVLRVKEQGFHVAHTVLLLLRMLQTYMIFQQAVPLLAADTARRAVELIKVTCSLLACTAALQTLPSATTASHALASKSALYINC